MNETQAREALCRVGARLYTRGHAQGTAGNISLHLADGGMLITPTDACLGTLDPARLARLDATGTQTAGDRASKTASLHRALVAAARAFDPGTCCVIHTHSSHCVARSLAVEGAAELLPALTPYFVMKVGHVPLLPYHRPGDPAVARLAAATVARYGAQGTPVRAVMLARLGPNVWHDSPESALAVLEELEETARLAMLVQPPPAALSEAALQDLRHSFAARW